jgi:hypothetical protein
VRDYIYNQLKDNFDLPVQAILPESGFFIMIDISKCKDLIPDKYKLTHDYDANDEESSHPIPKNRVFMDDGSIPLDLAFCR